MLWSCQFDFSKWIRGFMVRDMPRKSLYGTFPVWIFLWNMCGGCKRWCFRWLIKPMEDTNSDPIAALHAKSIPRNSDRNWSVA